MIFNSKSKIPGWFVGLTLLVTAGITYWAVLKKSPGEVWNTDPSLITNRVTQVLSPAVAAMDASQFKQVAATNQTPTIQVGAQSRHAERGPCTFCHLVVDALGATIPAIKAMSSIPHRYRGGICINCHKVPSRSSSSSVAGSGMTRSALRPLAFTRPQPINPLAVKPLAIKPQSVVPKKQPTEAAWLGMEVVPITKLTATQYKLPSNIRGLVLAETEAQAATAGLMAGDVLISVNGIPVGDMNAFLQATEQGKAPGGPVSILREGKVMSAVIGQSGQAAAPQPVRGGGAQPAAGAQVWRGPSRFGPAMGQGQGPTMGFGNRGGPGPMAGAGRGRGLGRGPGNGAGAGNNFAQPPGAGTSAARAGAGAGAAQGTGTQCPQRF